MKAIGIVRRIDELGRIVLPIELRRTMGINRDDPVGIFVDGDSIVLRKHESSCVLCGNTEDLSYFKEKTICSECRKQLKNQ